VITLDLKNWRCVQWHPNHYLYMFSMVELSGVEKGLADKTSKSKSLGFKSTFSKCKSKSSKKVLSPDSSKYYKYDVRMFLRQSIIFCSQPDCLADTDLERKSGVSC